MALLFSRRLTSIKIYLPFPIEKENYFYRKREEKYILNSINVYLELLRYKINEIKLLVSVNVILRRIMIIVLFMTGIFESNSGNFNIQVRLYKHI